MTTDFDIDKTMQLIEQIEHAEQTASKPKRLKKQAMPLQPDDCFVCSVGGDTSPITVTVKFEKDTTTVTSLTAAHWGDIPMEQASASMSMAQSYLMAEQKAKVRQRKQSAAGGHKAVDGRVAKLQTNGGATSHPLYQALLSAGVFAENKSPDAVFEFLSNVSLLVGDPELGVKTIEKIELDESWRLNATDKELRGMRVNYACGGQKSISLYSVKKWWRYHNPNVEIERDAEGQHSGGGRRHRSWAAPDLDWFKR